MKKRCEKPWERQEGESEKAFKAFVIYRDLGEDRTISAVVKRLEKSRNLIDRWKEKWNWSERVRQYDNELEKQAMAKAVKERKDMAERHIQIAMQFQKKALEALQALSIEDMSPRDIKDYIKMATELERLNRIREDKAEEINVSVSLADTITSAYKKRMENIKND